MTNKQILEDAKLAGFTCIQETGQVLLITVHNKFDLTSRLAKFAELTKAHSQWIDCSVELPKEKGLMVLTWDGEDYSFDCLDPDSDDDTWFNYSQALEHFQSVGGYGMCGNDCEVTFGQKQVTHWQPLPLPPNAQQERN